MLSAVIVAGVMGPLDRNRVEPAAAEIPATEAFSSDTSLLEGPLDAAVRISRRTPIAVVGLRDAILVLTDDATLVAHKSQAQKVKELVSKLAAAKEFKTGSRGFYANQKMEIDGKRYQVQVKDNLNAGTEWQNLGAPVTASGRTCPPWISPTTEGRVVIMKCRCPATRSR